MAACCEAAVWISLVTLNFSFKNFYQFLFFYTSANHPASSTSLFKVFECIATYLPFIKAGSTRPEFIHSFIHYISFHLVQEKQDSLKYILLSISQTILQVSATESQTFLSATWRCFNYRPKCSENRWLFSQWWKMSSVNEELLPPFWSQLGSSESTGWCRASFTCWKM